MPTSNTKALSRTTKQSTSQSGYKYIPKHTNTKQKLNNKYSSNYAMKRTVQSYCPKITQTCIETILYGNNEISSTNCDYFAGCTACAGCKGCKFPTSVGGQGCQDTGGCNVGKWGKSPNGCPCLGPKYGNGCITTVFDLNPGSSRGYGVFNVSKSNCVTAEIFYRGTVYSINNIDCAGQGLNCYWMNGDFSWTQGVNNDEFNETIYCTNNGTGGCNS
jgi:hypothetical protein